MPKPEIKRYSGDEFGRHQAHCPKCGFDSGWLLHLKTQDSFKCGMCRHQGPVEKFLGTPCRCMERVAEAERIWESLIKQETQGLEPSSLE